MQGKGLGTVAVCVKGEGGAAGETAAGAALGEGGVGEGCYVDESAFLR